jgi:hypothetical protein
VAYACKPSDSGGRDQEDYSPKFKSVPQKKKKKLKLDDGTYFYMSGNSKCVSKSINAANKIVVK